MQEKPAVRRKLSKRTLISALIILLFIPLAIAFGILFLDDRKYLFIGLVIIAAVMIPFFLVFENRKPQARELMVISVLCAIAVVGRIAFFMLPQFKPVAAIVIIAGVCFGPESGFLVGAVSGFVSNFFFGQGPFTPWQMFGFGLIGFVAGILFQKGLLPKKKLPLCIYGGLATFLIYGLIVNLGTVFTSNVPLTWPGILAIYLQAVPFDLIHGLSTVVFLFFLSRFMIETLDRMKIKYGLLEPS